MSNVPNSQRISLAAFFPLALQAVSLLQDVHNRRHFHGCVNTATLKLQLPDPAEALASLLDASPSQQPLAYISPEQSGRMNRETDFRSDY